MNQQVVCPPPPSTIVFPTAAANNPCYEFLDCPQLANRLNMPVSWVREHVRGRVTDPIPHFKMGKYVRFLWGSPELAAWLDRRMVNAHKKVVRSSGKERIQ